MSFKCAALKCFSGILVGVAAAVSLASCSSGGAAGGSVSGDAPSSVSAKPRIARLTDSMFLSEAEFPKREGLGCDPVKIRIVDQAEADLAGPGGVSAGDQMGDRQCDIRVEPHAYHPGTWSTFISLGVKPVPQNVQDDSASEAAKHLPVRDGKLAIDQINAPGLLPGAICYKQTYDGHSRIVVVEGFVRGAFVTGKVVGDADSEDEAAADAVAIFNRQAAKLNAI